MPTAPLPNLREEVANLAAKLVGDYTPRDKALIAEVLILRREILRDLTPLSLHSAYWRALNSCKSIDAKAYFTEMKRLRSVIVSEEYRTGTVGIKPLLSSPFKWITNPLIRIHQSTDLSVIDRFRAELAWVSFDSKLNLRDVDFKTENAVEYLDHEYKITHAVYDDDLLDSLKTIITEWFKDFSLSNYTPSPHFTGGATASLSRREATPRTKALSSTACYKDQTYIACREQPEFFQFDLEGLRFAYDEEPMVVDFVPKSPLTNRVISKEPTYRMFLQSDLRDALVKYVESKGLPIHLDNQQLSRDLALRGSESGKYATFDLKEASDSVTLTHIKRIFAGVPHLLNALLALRTESATCKLFKDEVIRLEKFAPMGSNLCFIIESIVFAAFCELAIRRCTGRRSTQFEYLVYGDDIVILCTYAYELRLLLSWGRFTVNNDKTFLDHAPLCYREACGIEAVCGVDVTPLRISRRYVGFIAGITPKGSSSFPSPPEFLGCVDFLNRLQLWGYRSARRYLHRELSKLPYSKYLWRVSEAQYKQDCLRWASGRQSVGQYICPTLITPDTSEPNWQLRRRVIPAQCLNGRKLPADTNRFEFRCLHVSSRPVKDPHDNVDLELWWTRHSSERRVDAIARLVEPNVEASNSGSSLKWSLRFTEASPL